MYSRVFARRALLAAAVGAGMIGGAASAAPVYPDTFAADASVAHDDPERLLLDLRFERPGAETRLLTRLRSGKFRDRAFPLRGWELLCERDYHAARYQAALLPCREAARRAPGDADDRQNAAIVEKLSRHGTVKAIGTTTVPIDPDGHVLALVGKARTEAIVDTGANISVMMRSVADAGGVKMLGLRIRMTTTTKDASVQLGLIPKVVIGGATIRNVPVAVMPDAELTFAGGQVRLPFILGVHALRAFGVVTWLDHGRRISLGEAPALAPGAGAPIAWHPLGVVVPIEGPRGRAGAHLDTGSNTTYLFDRGLDLLSPAEAASVVSSERRLGGVGGVVTERVRRIRKASLELAGQPLVLENVVVAAEPHTGESARLGEDLMARYDTVVLDFSRMRFSVRP